MESVAARPQLTQAQMVDLVTFRRDGTAVHTPVLSTPHDGVLLIRTHDTAGKLKRLRHNAEVTIAPMKGGKLVGPPELGTAVILPTSEVERGLELLHRRHGAIGHLATWIRHMRRMRDVFIEVRPA